MTKKHTAPQGGQAAALLASLLKTSTAPSSTMSAPFKTPHLTESQDGSMLISQRRMSAILSAGWEISELTLLLAKLATEPTDLDEGPSLAMRGISLRINDLNNAILGGINDTSEPTFVLERTVFGAYISREEEGVNK